MREKTKLENAIFANPQYAQAIRSVASSEELQRILDMISDEVCDALTPSELLEHTRIVYDETAPIYAGHSDHLNIPDQLIAFMQMLPRGANFVLDLGCGAGRDTVFMALKEQELRRKFMGRMKDGKNTAERFGIPTDSYYALGVDSSERMIHLARGLADACGLTAGARGVRRAEFTHISDMHQLSDYETMFWKFNAVWSSAALFMHTPRQLIAHALFNVAQVLYRGGIFGVSYANVPIGTPYNNLRHSRTGEIKYFSRPSKEEITGVAATVGLRLFLETYSDLQVGADVKTGFFVTQFFRKV